MKKGILILMFLTGVTGILSAQSIMTLSVGAASSYTYIKYTETNENIQFTSLLGTSVKFTYIVANGLGFLIDIHGGLIRRYLVGDSDGNLFGFNSSTWDKTILGKAARQSVEKCVKYIKKGMKKIPWQGKIIKANPDGTVFMKPGSQAGVAPGMQFWVYRPGEDLIDPDTGISLGSEESKIGKIEVVADIGGGKACKAIIKGGSGFNTGDFVRLK